jgi:soluble lytic murein transglycosylase-like protein
MDWRNALQAVKQFRLPRTRALQQELATLHAEHNAVSGELLEVRTALERTRTDDARQIELLQQQAGHLASDRDSAHEQTRLLETALQDARDRQSATEQRIAALELQLDDARHLHESNLYLTRDTLSHLQSEQHNLLSLQSDMARSFHDTSHELLKSLQAQARMRPPVWQLAAVAGLLFLSGALATALILGSTRSERVDLSGISNGIGDLQQLMQAHFRTHDELLQVLTRAIGTREGADPLPDNSVAPDPSPASQGPQELLHGGVQRDAPEAVAADAVRRDLETLGLLTGQGAVDEAALDHALQRFAMLYSVPAGSETVLHDRLHAVAEQARTDASRYRLDSTVVAAIRLGSKRTGVEFPYLMELAAVESSFDPAARAKTSSATGIYQFKDETWLEAVKRYGKRYGLDQYASHIELVEDDSGLRQPHITDPELQQRILDLRLNPRLSALLAAENIKASQRQLGSRLARKPARTDLYLSHFFGNTGALSFLKALAENPEQIAVDIFPGPALRNRNIFHKHDDKPRTVAEVYRLLTRKFNTARFEES